MHWFNSFLGFCLSYLLKFQISPTFGSALKSRERADRTSGYLGSFTWSATLNTQSKWPSHNYTRWVTFLNTLSSWFAIDLDMTAELVWSCCIQLVSLGFPLQFLFGFHFLLAPYNSLLGISAPQFDRQTSFFSTNLPLLPMVLSMSCCSSIIYSIGWIPIMIFKFLWRVTGFQEK